jgi:hypothetical protein
MHDARGIAEPLERYGELLACQIVGLYNALHGLPDTSQHCRARLSRLYHEAEGLPVTGKLLLRPAYQWRYGYNHQTIYRAAPGTSRLLLSSGLYDATTVRWAAATRIVPISTPDREPPLHDAMVSFILSSMEIAVQRSERLRFITHLDVIRNASSEAKLAQAPLSIPIKNVSHTFASGHAAMLADTSVRPDALFGVRYPPEDDPTFHFFALEFDRGTEDVAPSKTLSKASWLRKVLSYSAISAGPAPLYQRYLRVPALSVLCVFCQPERLVNVMELVGGTAINPRQFVFKAIPAFDPLLAVSPMPQLFNEPWQSVSGPVNLTTMSERG